ncbi:MAG: glycosyltransferase family 2 protein [Chitinophagaceae bacterium]|nr:glycosyltransferase family 2 protein [Chitinophagaceae bacterium]
MNTVDNLPRITVGVPTYNRPDGLKKCLQSISRQTYANLEIIISNNCSTNEQVQPVIDAFASADSRVKVITQSTNIGLEENFNAVFAASTTDYFIWMSDDDYFDPDYIEKCVQFLNNNPDYVLCSGTAKYYSGDDFLFTEKMFFVDQSKASLRLFSYFSKVEKNGNFYGVFRNRIFLEKPIKPHIGCDWSFMAKLAIIGKLGYLNDVYYHRSIEGNSGTRRKMIRKFRFNKIQSLFFETYSAYIIATNIFNDKTVAERFSFFTRKAMVLTIFIQINYKLFMKFTRKILLGIR